jgi:Arc/MetJ-type ribon-helix-helix transcriptional regulator
LRNIFAGINLKKKKQESTIWAIPVPKSLDAAVEMCVELDRYATKTDFVRDACRRLLEQLGFKNSMEAPQPC